MPSCQPHEENVVRPANGRRQREQQTCGRDALVPLAFPPGEAFQFDWSEDWALIAGERTKLQAANSSFAAAAPFILRVYLQQAHEMPPVVDRSWPRRPADVA